MQTVGTGANTPKQVKQVLAAPPKRLSLNKSAPYVKPKPSVSAPKRAPHTNAVSRRINRTPTPARKVTKAPVARITRPVTKTPTRRPVAKVVAKTKPVAKPVAKKIPSIEEYLRGDTGYMQSEADLKRAGDQYSSQYNNDLQQYGEEYNLNNTNLKSAYDEANTAMTDDYAARGMLSGGGYAKAYGDQKTEYAGRQAAMDNARTQYLSNQANSQTNFQEEQRITGQNAKNAAIARRAAGLG